MSTVEVWYLIKGAGEPHLVRVPDGSYISDLKDAIREKNPRKLGHLDANDLIIKTGQMGEALDPGNEVAQIKGGEMSTTPLYVDFPEVEEPALKRARTQEAHEFMQIVSARFPDLPMQLAMLEALVDSADTKTLKRLEYLLKGDQARSEPDAPTFGTKLGEFLDKVGKGKVSFTWAKDFASDRGLLRLQSNAMCFAAAVATFIAYTVKGNNRNNTINALKTILCKSPPEAIVTYLQGGGYPAISFLLAATGWSRDAFLQLPCSVYVERGEAVLKRYLEESGVGLVTSFATTPSFKDVNQVEYINFAGDRGQMHAMVLLGHYENRGQTLFVLQNGWLSKPFLAVTWQGFVDAGAVIYFKRDADAQLELKDVSVDLMTEAQFVECAMEAGPDASEPDWLACAVNG